MSSRAIQDTAGESTFWTYRDNIIRENDLSEEGIKKTVESVDGSPEEIWEATSSQKYRPVVSNDRTHADEAGIGGTPGVIVNGSVVEHPDDNSEKSYEQVIREAIESAIN